MVPRDLIFFIQHLKVAIFSEKYEMTKSITLKPLLFFFFWTSIEINRLFWEFLSHNSVTNVRTYKLRW